MNRDKTRSGMQGAAAVYLLYLAYSLLKGAGSADSGISPFVRVLFIVLFGLGGAALLVYAARLWLRGRKEDKEEWEKERTGGPGGSR